MRPALPLVAYPIVRADYFLLFFPPLMEDVATGRISVAQTAQRILHKAKDSNTGHAHDFALTKQVLQEELADIIKRRTDAAPTGEACQAELQAQVARYESALKIPSAGRRTTRS